MDMGGRKHFTNEEVIRTSRLIEENAMKEQANDVFDMQLCDGLEKRLIP